MAGMLRAMLLATGTRLGALGLLAAVHPAIVVPVGAAAFRVARMAFGRGLLSVLSVAQTVLGVTRAILLVLLAMVLVLGVTLMLPMTLMLGVTRSGRRLSGRRGGDQQCDRHAEIFHFQSPERIDLQSVFQASRGGGGSASSWIPSKNRAVTASGAINSGAVISGWSMAAGIIVAQAIMQSIIAPSVPP